MLWTATPLFFGEPPMVFAGTNTELHITSTPGSGPAALKVRPQALIGLRMLESQGRCERPIVPRFADVYFVAFSNRSLT